MKSFVIAACLAAAALPARAATVEQPSTDVQILQAWTAGALGLDVSQCQGPTPALGQSVTKDCTAAGQAASRAPWATQDSPTIGSWSLVVENFNGMIYARNSAGNLVEIRALVKRSALSAPSFRGIGFYSDNGLGSGQTFVAKAALHVVSGGDVTLASTGEKAAVLRFVVFLPGTAGDSSTGWSMDSVDFKPFARYQVGDQTFQNWDIAAVNYRIYRASNGGGTPQVASFDRQAQLLQP